MPIHKKIDSIGISTHLQQDTLTEGSYLRWLVNSRAFISRVSDIKFENRDRSIDVLTFLPDDLGLDQLNQDIKDISPNWELGCTDKNKVPFDNDESLTIPVYTMLGSLMGSNMILGYLTVNRPSYPTQYLKHVLTYKSNWKSFLSFLSEHPPIADVDIFKNKIREFWEQIYDDHTSN